MLTWRLVFMQEELKQCSYMQTCVQEELKQCIYMQTCVQEELKQFTCTLAFSEELHENLA